MDCWSPKCHCSFKVTQKVMFWFWPTNFPSWGGRGPFESLEGWHAKVSDFPFSKTAICFCGGLSVSVWKALNSQEVVGDWLALLVRCLSPWWDGFRTLKVKDLVFRPDSLSLQGAVHREPEGSGSCLGPALDFNWNHGDSGMIAWNRKEDGRGARDGHHRGGLCSSLVPYA